MRGARERQLCRKIEMHEESRSSSVVQSQRVEKKPIITSMSVFIQRQCRCQDCVLDLQTSHWHSACLQSEQEINDSVIAISIVYIR